MATQQDFKRRRVSSIPTEALKAGDIYALNVGGGKYKEIIINNTLQPTIEAGADFIEKDTMAEFRAITPREIWAIQNGYYKGVKLNGYYTAGDTPAPIDYYISNTADLDDGGGIIVVGTTKFEHYFLNDTVDIRYFGAQLSPQYNSSVIMNRLLSRGYNITTGSGTAYITATVNILPGSAIRNSTIELRTAVTGLILHRGAGIYDTRILASSVNMDTNYALLFRHAYSTAETDLKYTISNVSILGNRSALQGQALGAEVVKDTTSNYSLIQFIKVSGLNIDGFRDGIVLKTDYSNATDGRIIYCNGNIFENVNISYCLRPIRLLNQNCALSNIRSGNAQIAGNIFRNIVIQHYVESFPAVECQGVSQNEFDIFIFDWVSNEYTFDNRCYDNEILNPNTLKSKVGQQINNTSIRREATVKAKAIFNGTTGNLSSAYFLGGVTKNDIGSFNIIFADDLKMTPNVAVSFKDINDYNKTAIINYIDSEYCNLQILSNSTGANVDSGDIMLTFY